MKAFSSCFLSDIFSWSEVFYFCGLFYFSVYLVFCLFCLFLLFLYFVLYILFVYLFYLFLFILLPAYFVYSVYFIFSVYSISLFISLFIFLFISLFISLLYFCGLFFISLLYLCGLFYFSAVDSSVYVASFLWSVDFVRCSVVEIFLLFSRFFTNSVMVYFDVLYTLYFDAIL